MESMTRGAEYTASGHQRLPLPSCPQETKTSPFGLGCFCCRWIAIYWIYLRPPVFLLYVCVLVTQSCPTLCDPMDCSLTGSSVPGVLQARILDWVAMPFSTGSSWPRHQTRVSWIASRFFTMEPPGKPNSAPWFYFSCHIFLFFKLGCCILFGILLGEITVQYMCVPNMPRFLKNMLYWW